MDQDVLKTVAQRLQLLNAPATDVMFHGLTMKPVLQEGDRVVVEKVLFEEVREGDIITYRDRDKYPTRRVVIKKKHRLVLWCDNWPTRQFQVQADDVLGRVISRDRAGSILKNTDPEWQKLTRQAMRRFRLSQTSNVWHFIRREISRLLKIVQSRSNEAQ